MTKKIVLASNNQGKIQEFNAILAEKPFQLIPQGQLNISEVEETGTTFIENAIIKARHAAEQSGLPTIADDSGLIIDALNGRPGIYSARYAGKESSNAEKIKKILDEMKEVLPSARSARFICVIAFMRAYDDPAPIICEGIWEGAILNEPHGEYGFGYDPIFWAKEYNCSSAELNPSIKNQISHRAIALAKLAANFQQLECLRDHCCVN